jgi:BirA family biotin operon repressor/biotin-[acetyl-CoA-carboxylase] ligase
MSADRPSTVPSNLADALRAAEPRLNGLGQPMLYFSTAGSTNDIAAAFAETGQNDGAVVLAETQTSGRGRHGRQWFSPAGAGLYVSVLLTPRPVNIDNAGNPDNADHAAAGRAVALLTLAAGVALAESIEAVTGFRPDIKWPNDLLAGRRKIAGILAEGMTTAGRLTGIVLGYGINVGRASFPPDLAGTASSLETELGRPIDRTTLFIESLCALARRRDDLAAGRFDAILDAWLERAPASRGSHVAWQSASGPRTGVTCGIDERGALLVRIGDRTERILAGTVTWL